MQQARLRGPAGHKSLLTARKGLPGHVIYGVVRNSTEVLEFLGLLPGQRAARVKALVEEGWSQESIVRMGIFCARGESTEEEELVLETSNSSASGYVCVYEERGRYFAKLGSKGLRLGGMHATAVEAARHRAREVAKEEGEEGAGKAANKAKARAVKVVDKAVARAETALATAEASSSAVSAEEAGDGGGLGGGGGCGGGGGGGGGGDEPPDLDNAITHEQVERVEQALGFEGPWPSWPERRRAAVDLLNSKRMRLRALGFGVGICREYKCRWWMQWAWAWLEKNHPGWLRSWLLGEAAWYQKVLVDDVNGIGWVITQLMPFQRLGAAGCSHIETKRSTEQHKALRRCTHGDEQLDFEAMHRLFHQQTGRYACIRAFERMLVWGAIEHRVEEWGGGGNPGEPISPTCLLMLIALAAACFYGEALMLALLVGGTPTAEQEAVRAWQHHTDAHVIAAIRQWLFSSDGSVNGLVTQGRALLLEVFDADGTIHGWPVTCREDFVCAILELRRGSDKVRRAAGVPLLETEAQARERAGEMVDGLSHLDAEHHLAPGAKGWRLMLQSHEAGGESERLCGREGHHSKRLSNLLGLRQPPLPLVQLQPAPARLQRLHAYSKGLEPASQEAELAMVAAAKGKAPGVAPLVAELQRLAHGLLASTHPSVVELCLNHLLVELEQLGGEPLAEAARGFVSARAAWTRHESRPQVRARSGGGKRTSQQRRAVETIDEAATLRPHAERAAVSAEGPATSLLRRWLDNNEFADLEARRQRRICVLLLALQASPSLELLLDADAILTERSCLQALKVIDGLGLLGPLETAPVVEASALKQLARRAIEAAAAAGDAATFEQLVAFARARDLAIEVHSAIIDGALSAAAAWLPESFDTFIAWAKESGIDSQLHESRLSDILQRTKKAGETAAAAGDAATFRRWEPFACKFLPPAYVAQLRAQLERRVFAMLHQTNEPTLTQLENAKVQGMTGQQLLPHVRRALGAAVARGDKDVFDALLPLAVGFCGLNMKTDIKPLSVMRNQIQRRSSKKQRTG